MDGIQRLRGGQRWGDRVRPIAIAVAFLAGTSCLKLPEPEGRKAAVKKVAVTLPPRPNLAAPPVPERHPDGTFTVAGFLRRAAEIHAGGPDRRAVTVRGYVQEVVQCPEGARMCPTVPHLVLVDSTTTPRHRLFVVSDPPEAVLQGFPAKSEQTLQGEVALWSPDGRLVDLRGLLLIKPKPAGPGEATPNR